MVKAKQDSHKFQCLIMDLLNDKFESAKNMLVDFAETLRRELPSHITLHSMKLRETCTSFAEWFAEDN